jgi:hypothetical protein
MKFFYQLRFFSFDNDYGKKLKKVENFLDLKNSKSKSSPF